MAGTSAGINAMSFTAHQGNSSMARSQLIHTAVGSWCTRQEVRNVRMGAKESLPFWTSPSMSDPNCPLSWPDHLQAEPTREVQEPEDRSGSAAACNGCCSHQQGVSSA